jgi:hypothetical protein
MVLGGYPVQEAHNDPLQVLAETGVLGFLPFAAFWILFLVVGLKACSRQGSSSVKWLRIGIFFGIFSFLLHSLVDFDFEIPGIALNVFALAGLLVATSNEPQKTVRFGWGKGIIVLAALAAATTLAIRPHVAEALFNGTGFAAPGIVQAWWKLFLSARLLACAVLIAILSGVTARMTGSHPDRSGAIHGISVNLASAAVVVTVLLTLWGLLNIWFLTTDVINANGFGQNYRANQLEAVQKIFSGEEVPDILLVTLFPWPKEYEEARSLQEEGPELVSMARAKLQQVKVELSVASKIYPRRATYRVFIGEIDLWLAPFEQNPAMRMEEAIVSLERAVELNPWSHYWPMLLGDAYMRRSALGEWAYYSSKAVKEFERAVENYPHDPETRLQLAGALLYTGQRSRAEDCIEQARELQKYMR